MAPGLLDNAPSVPRGHEPAHCEQCHIRCIGQLLIGDIESNSVFPGPPHTNTQTIKHLCDTLWGCATREGDMGRDVPDEIVSGNCQAVLQQLGTLTDKTSELRPFPHKQLTILSGFCAADIGSRRVKHGGSTKWLSWPKPHQQ